MYKRQDPAMVKFNSIFLPLQWHRKSEQLSVIGYILLWSVTGT